VSIELPPGASGERRPIEVQAEVVHRVTPDEAKATGRPAGVGVQFVGADDSFRERLDAFLARAG
jgi:Tfp pilus assembly protein PilZ